MNRIRWHMVDGGESICMGLFNVNGISMWLDVAKIKFQGDHDGGVWVGAIADPQTLLIPAEPDVKGLGYHDTIAECKAAVERRLLDDQAEAHADAVRDHRSAPDEKDEQSARRKRER